MGSTVESLGQNEPNEATLSQRQLDAFWMPFTSNRDFKQQPRIIVGAKGHFYKAADGRQVYDLFSGLWSSGIGHGHPKIVEAITKQASELDYCMSFQLGNDKAFLLADRLAGLAPEGMDHVFFTNSGSEAVDTALKIALAYHQANGDFSRVGLVGRERGYHGANFGGISVGGIMPNRQLYQGNLLPRVYHLSTTYDREHQAFTDGQPQWGSHLVEELEKICRVNGSHNIAAVIVEPAAGSTGILPPPIGYLERLREICTKHGILLIFDEVITGLGRVGDSFAAQRMQVIPDIITTAKSLTNSMVPMGAAIVNKKIYQTIVDDSRSDNRNVEFFHGYTYSGHPIAAAAGLATLDIFEQEGTFETAKELETLFSELLHSFDDHPKVIDVRNFGLMGAIELETRDNQLGARGLETHKRCFWEQNVVLRNSSDILQFSPFLNAKPEDLERSFSAIKKVLDTIE